MKPSRILQVVTVFLLIIPSIVFAENIHEKKKIAGSQKLTPFQFSVLFRFLERKDLWLA